MFRVWLVASVGWAMACGALAVESIRTHERFLMSAAIWRLEPDSQAPNPAMGPHRCGSSGAAYYDFDVKYGIAPPPSKEAKTCERQAARKLQSATRHLT